MVVSYPTLTRTDAEAFLEQRSLEPHEASIQPNTHFAGAGESLDLECFSDLEQALRHAIEDVEFRANRQNIGLLFEQSAGVLVHQALGPVPRSVLRDPGFWRWLAAVRLPWVVEWRFGSDHKLAQVKNYGIGSPKDNLLFRLWLRGEIGYEPSATDPYALARVGDQDLWRSHIVRQGYGNAHEISRALLKLQTGTLGREKLPTLSIRALARQLRRIRANVYLEILDSKGAEELILELSQDL